MHSVAGKRVEEHRQCRYERLSLTGRHLGYLSLMQRDTSEELHVVVHHFPFQVVSSGCPVVVVYRLVTVYCDEVLFRVGGKLAVEVCGSDNGLLVLSEAACRILHDAECHGHHLVESFLIYLQHFLLQLVYFVEDGLALVYRRVLYFCLQSLNLVLLLFCGVLHISLYFLGSGSQFVVTQLLYLRIHGLHAFHKRLYEFHVSG